MKKKFLLNTILLFLVMTVYSQNFKLENLSLSNGENFGISEIKFLSDSKLEYEYISNSYPIRVGLYSSEYGEIKSIITHDYLIKKDNGITYILLSEPIEIDELIHPESWGMRDRIKKDGELTDDVIKKSIF